MFYNITTILLFIFCKFLFRLEVKGTKSFPEKSPFILASNHISNLDPVILGVSAFPRRVYFLAKEELFANKLFTFILRDLGAVSLKRQRGDIGAIRSVLKIIKKKPLVIFPQGTRKLGFNKAASGVGFFYKKANIPVVAAKIYGSDKVLPKGAKFFHQGRIKVIFSRVANINDSDSYEGVTLKVIDTIKNL